MSLLKLKETFSRLKNAAGRLGLSMMGVLLGEDHELPTTSIHALFDRQVMKNNPIQNTSLITESKRLSFENVKISSEKLSKNLLAELGARGDKLEEPMALGLYTGANEWRIIAMLAILRINCAFVAIDSTIPPERADYMFKEANVKYVLFDGPESTDFVKQIVNLNHHLQPIDLIDIVEEEPDFDISEYSYNTSMHDNPVVCILFTSGSTGRPKGVPITTSNLINRLVWQWDSIPFHENDTACHKTSVLFIDSMTEIFGALLKGIPLVILNKETVSQPERFVSAINQHKITRIVLSPSHLRILTNYLDATKYLNKVFSVNTIISSGENLTVDIAKMAFSVFPLRTVLYNLYGSTETTGDVTYQCLNTPEDIDEFSHEGSVSIGRPVYNTCAVILNEKYAVCATGEKGIIYVSGFNIAKGYLNPSNIQQGTLSLTENRIFTKHGHEVLHGMGDIAVLKNGRLYHQGRVDSIVKVRGHRVDLREIEMLANQQEEIHCIVLPYKDIHGYIVPIAFYTASSVSSISKDELNRWARKHLPSYALPRFYYMEEFPLLRHSIKIDRQAMVEAYHRAVLGDGGGNGTFKFDQTDQQIIRKIIAKNLAMPHVELDLGKSFFEVGGNSITALVTIADLNSGGLDISLQDLIGAKSITELLTPKSEQVMEQKYEIKLLKSVPDNEAAFKILVDGFIKKNPLDVLAGTKPQQFSKFLRPLWEVIKTQGLSNVAVDKSTGAIVGVTIVTELEEPEGLEFYEPAEVYEINKAVEDPAKESLLRSGGKWADSLLDAVDMSLPDSDALGVLEMMDIFSEETAKSKGYDGVFVINSHPATMALAERRGYKTMNTLHVKSFYYNDTYPFKDAEGSYYIKAMLFKFSK